MLSFTVQKAALDDILQEYHATSSVALKGLFIQNVYKKKVLNV